MARKLKRTARRRRKGGMPIGMILLLGVLVLIIYGNRIKELANGKTQLNQPSELTALSDTVRLDAQDYYAIQFGVYENKAAAQEKALEYVGRGAAGYIWEEAGTYRVLAAVYASLDDAQTIKERLKTQGIDAYIYTISQPALEMRVSANEEQRELLSEIFGFLPRAIREIGDVSLSLDKQTMQPTEAFERMSMLAQTAQQYFMRANTQLGADADGIVDEIRGLLEEIAKKCRDFSQNSQEDLSITAKIKYNYLEVLWNVRRFVQGVLA